MPVSKRFKREARREIRRLRAERMSEFGAKNPMLVAAATGFLKKAQKAAAAEEKGTAKRLLSQAETKLGQTDAGSVSQMPKIGRIMAQAQYGLNSNRPGSMVAEQIGLILKALKQSRIKIN